MKAREWVDIGITFEMEFSGEGSGWTDVTDDILEEPVPRWNWGIKGTGPLDLVAGPGTFSFGLKNSVGNSGGKDGYYSPGHTNVRSGFGIGIGVRIKRVRGVNPIYKRYTIKTITPTAGSNNRRDTLCFATDWMDLAGDIKLTGLTADVDQSEKDVYNSVIAAIPSAVRPVGGNGQSTEVTDSYPFVFDNANQQRETALAVLQKLAQSSFGTIFLGQDITDGEFLSRAGRSGRWSTPSPPTFIFDNDMVDLVVRRDRNRIVNVIDIISPIRRVDDDSTTVLYSIESDRPTVPAGSSITIHLDYSDPNNDAQSVSGIEMVDPVATTDFTMNANAEGTGADLTSDHTVTPTYSSSSVKLVIANTGSDNSVVTFLRGRGKGLYSYAKRHTRVENATSVAQYGERLLSFTVPWNTDINYAQGMADWLLTQYEDEDAPGIIDATLSVIANHHDDFDNWTWQFDINTAIDFTEDQTGETSGDAHFWRIMWIENEWIQNKVLKIKYILRREEGDQGWWVLGVSASDDLGVDTKLGYF